MGWTGALTGIDQMPPPKNSLRRDVGEIAQNLKDSFPFFGLGEEAHFTAFFKAFPAENLGTFFALILISAPV